MEEEKQSFAEIFLTDNLPKLHKTKIEKAVTKLHSKPIMLVNETTKKNNKIRPKKTKIPKFIKVKQNMKTNPTYKYSEYEMLRQLWSEYIHKLIFDGNSKIDNKIIQEMLLKADYHGANIKVCESKCKAYKGIKGTVITETKNMFQVVTTENKTSMIPKKNSIFELMISNYRVVIFGDQFCIKPSHRLTKKFKNFVPYINLVSEK